MAETACGQCEKMGSLGDDGEWYMRERHQDYHTDPSPSSPAVALPSSPLTWARRLQDNS